MADEVNWADDKSMASRIREEGLGLGDNQDSGQEDQSGQNDQNSQNENGQENQNSQTDQASQESQEGQSGQNGQEQNDQTSQNGQQDQGDQGEQGQEGGEQEPEGQKSKSLNTLFGGESEDQGESQQPQQPQVDPQVQQELEQYGVKDPSDPNQVVQAIRNAKQQANGLPEDLQNDPVFQDFRQWREQGGTDVGEFAKRYSVPDPSTLDEQEVVRKQMEIDNYSQEAINEALDGWEDLTPLQKEDKVKGAMGKLQQMYQKQEEYKKQAPNPQDQAQQQQKDKIDKFTNEYSSLLSNTVGNEVYGWQVTEDVAKDVEQKPFQTGRVVVTNDGDLDPKGTAMLHLIESYGDKIFETVKTQAKNELNEHEFQQTQLPGKSDTPTRTNHDGGNMTVEQKAEKALESATGRNLGR